MRALISGASGLIGSSLERRLQAGSWSTVRLVRAPAAADANSIVWDPAVGFRQPKDAEGFDLVVHLAGENVAGGRWTAARKQRILESRVQGTRRLCETISRLEHRPRTLLCASAIGIYGDRGEELLDEQSAPGHGFLAEVCQQWEAATAPAREAGVRVVNLRFGVVLSKAGGALAKMLLPFRMGLGGRIGNGRQYMSWIALDDVVRAIEWSATHESLKGPVNVVAPRPVTNREFTTELGRALRRPTIFPLPAFVARAALGEMAGELLLASQRVAPAQLAATGFSFSFPELGPALRHVLAKETTAA